MLQTVSRRQMHILHCNYTLRQNEAIVLYSIKLVAAILLPVEEGNGQSLLKLGQTILGA